MAVNAKESPNLDHVAPFAELKADIDEKATKKTQIQALWVSSIPWGQLTPLLFVGTLDSSNTLHAYVPTEIMTPPSSLDHQTDVILDCRPPPTLIFNHHLSYKHVHHLCAQLLESWGMYLTLTDTKLALYTLPLLTNSEIAQSDELHKNKHKSLKISAPSKSMFIVSDTKQTTLFNAFEPGKTIVCGNKQHILKVFERSSEQSVQLRVQYDLASLLRDKKNDIKVSNMVLPLRNLVVVGDNHALLVFKKGWGLLELSSGEFVKIHDDLIEDLGTEIGACMLVKDTLGKRIDGSRRFQGVFMAGKQKGCILTFEALKAVEHSSRVTGNKKRWIVRKNNWVAYNVAPKAAYCAFPYLLLDFQDNVKVYQIGLTDIVQELPIRSLQAGFIWESKQLSSSLLSNSTYFVGVTAPLQLHFWRLGSLKDQVQAYIRSKMWKQAVALIELCPENCDITEEESRNVYKKLGFSTFYNNDSDTDHQTRLKTAMKYFFRARLSVLDVLHIFPHELLPQIDQPAVVNQQHADDTMLFTDKFDLSMVQKILALMYYLKKSRARLVSEACELDTLALVDTVRMKTLVFLSRVEKCQAQALMELSKLFQCDNYCDVKESEWYLRAYDLRENLLMFFTERKLHRNALELMEELRDEVHTKEANTETEMSPQAIKLHSEEFYLEKMAVYLQNLDPEHENLFFEFAGRVVFRSPRLGLCIFINRSVIGSSEHKVDFLTLKDYLISLKTKQIGSESSSQIDASNCDLLLEDSVVLPLVNGRFMAIEYLVRLVYACPRPVDIRIHDDVVTLLIDSIELELNEKENAKARMAESFAQMGVLGLLRRRLIHFLQHPKAKYHPERLLSRLRKEMVDERVTCLSALGRHSEVLQLYIRELGDFKLAESYCARCYKLHRDPSIYTSLLKIILLYRSDSEEKDTIETSGEMDPNQIESNSVRMAVEVLNKFPERMEASIALNLLPADVPVASMIPFLCCTFDVQVDQYRNGQVQTQLAKMENFRVRGLLSMRRKASVTIWASQCCQICECKLGLGTTVRLPEGSLVHYGCHLAQVGDHGAIG